MMQVAGDDSLLNTSVDYLFQAYIDDYDFDKEYEYELVGTGGYYVVKYIPEYNWYLCVEKPEKINEMRNVVMENLNAASCAGSLLLQFPISEMETYKAPG